MPDDKKILAGLVTVVRELLPVKNCRTQQQQLTRLLCLYTFSSKFAVLEAIYCGARGCVRIASEKPQWALEAPTFNVIAGVAAYGLSATTYSTRYDRNKLLADIVNEAEQSVLNAHLLEDMPAMQALHEAKQYAKRVRTLLR